MSKKASKQDYNNRYYKNNREKLIAEQKARDKKADPEAKRKYRREYYLKNRERLLELQRARNRERYQKVKGAPAQKARARKSILAKYGLTPQTYQDMLDAQGGGCAICTASPRIRRMAVDHCHSTGKVRGILCTQCNTAIGLLGDSPDRILEVVDYLTSSSSGAT